MRYLWRLEERRTKSSDDMLRLFPKKIIYQLIWDSLKSGGRKWEYINVQCISLKFPLCKRDYARTRARDSKHLPAVILNIFCEYTRVMFDKVIPTKKNGFQQGFHE